jgi:hypothetical protein
MNLVSRRTRLLVCLYAVTLLGLASGCATTPLAPRDKAVLVTAADLLDLGADLPLTFAEYEHNHKTSRIDGGVEIEYQFDARDSGEGYPYIYSTINRETTLSSAVAAYGAVKAGLGLADLEARDDSVRFRYGDWSWFGTLVFEGEVRGFVFCMRDELTVYTLMISGFPMDVDAMWGQLVLPRLEMLSLVQQTAWN